MPIAVSTTGSSNAHVPGSGTGDGLGPLRNAPESDVYVTPVGNTMLTADVFRKSPLANPPPRVDLSMNPTVVWPGAKA